MPWNDAEELLVASNGQVYSAPVGTTLPAVGSAADASLNAAFVGAGYLTEDGFTTTIGSEVTDFMSWQELDPTRREKTASNKSIAFSMQQWNEENIVLAFGGGTVDSSGGDYSYVFPEGDEALEERSLIIDAIDGDKNYRFVFARGNVTEDVESTFQRGALALLPVTFRVLKPTSGPSAYVNTNDPSFTAGS